MQRELREGDEVMLKLNPLTVGITKGMWKWDECIFRISKVKYSNHPSINGPVYFELEHCVSEKGVPYAVLREWIFPTGGGRND
jgi:hypothetical protein